VKCYCKPNAGCVKCSFEKIDTPEWPELVKNRLADELEELILQCKHNYYCAGESKISDYMYDRYEDGLKHMRPTSWVLEAVGCQLCHKES